MSNNNTYYHFLPAVRQGLSRWIKEEKVDAKRADIALNVNLKARKKDSGSNYDYKAFELCVQLHGPGDVVGFDPKIIVRTEPQTATYDFEPNYFPFIEFANADFAWRYSAATVKDIGNSKYIQPWIVLAVLESGVKNNSEEFDSEETEYVIHRQSAKGMPDLIEVDAKNLPNIDNAWQWAHVQIGGNSDLTDVDIKAMLEEENSSVTCRLMCPRKLKPNQRYCCFVLPSTMLGRFAGTHKAPLNNIDAYTPAWNLGDGKIKVPVYCKWEFHTGASGDFEHLVRLLKPRKLSNMGLKEMDCSKPGYGTESIRRVTISDSTELHTLQIEGALKSLDTQYSAWGVDPMVDFTDGEHIYKIRIEVFPDKNSVNVLWKTTSTGTSKIYYGEGSPDSSKTSTSGTTDHCVKITNLSVNTIYSFRIEFNSTDGLKKINGRFAIPEDSTFQIELAALINKPITEDLELESFAIAVDDTDWLTEFSSNLLPSGSEVEITCKTSSDIKLKVSYLRNNEEPQTAKETSEDGFSTIHSLILESLLPGITYLMNIIGTDNRGVENNIGGISFKMPALPSVVPPIYGRWHYGKYRIKNGRKTLVDASYQKNWIDQLNLDPRHRAAAGIGSKIVKKNQEDIMSAAWDQLGAIDNINDLMRRRQFARESGGNILDRIKVLPQEEYLRTLLPITGKVMISQADKHITAFKYITRNTRIPQAVANNSFTKIYRQVNKNARTFNPASNSSIFKNLMAGNVNTKQLNVKPVGTMVMDDITADITPGTTSRTFSAVSIPYDSAEMASVAGYQNKLNKTAVVEVLLDDPFSDVPALRDQTKTADILGDAVEGWLNIQTDTDDISPSENAEEELQSIKNQMVEKIQPAYISVKQTQLQARLNGLLQSRFTEVEGDCLNPIMAAPEFPQPTHDLLIEHSKNTFLPGIENIKPNTIGLLETNQRFLEAFMCGLNHELATELLWRGYPTDQRGSYFRQFWDTGYKLPNSNEIQNMYINWLSERNATGLDDLEKEEKEILIYKYSRSFLRYISYIEGKLSHYNVYNDITITDPNDKAEILKQLLTVLFKVKNNYPDAFKDIKDIVFAGFDPFVKDKIIAECKKESGFEIDPLHKWNDRLGKNGKFTEEKTVLIIRGDLLKRYPNATIYAVNGYRPNEDEPNTTIPAVEECLREHYGSLPDGERPDENEIDSQVNTILEDNPKIYPIFGAQALPDITFLGFPFDKYAAKKTTEKAGIYFVIEEHVSEPRFGLDIVDVGSTPPDLTSGTGPNWDNLSWNHFKTLNGEYLDTKTEIGQTDNFDEDSWDEWMQSSAAEKANITFQKPVRIIIGANEMLPT